MEQQAVGHAVRENPDRRIERFNSFVVPCTCDIDPVLSALELMLEVKEVLVRLEIRVLFYNDQQP